MSEDADDGPLDHPEKCNRLAEALAKLVDYYVEEYGVTMAEVIGTLETEKWNRMHWIAHSEDDD